eukprot:TRINITY_DN14835_c0_g1_i9.p1 TRINITY_DN14835_c0_g1~~TRINITY_DN14835_c0_g1_i9.p1  ORF type:complete len:235 (-),score=6.10 TRINITY_DN14835_c0_g1_i9:670-1374(-)
MRGSRHLNTHPSHSLHGGLFIDTVRSSGLHQSFSGALSSPWSESESRAAYLGRHNSSRRHHRTPHLNPVCSPGSNTSLDLSAKLHQMPGSAPSGAAIPGLSCTGSPLRMIKARIAPASHRFRAGRGPRSQGGMANTHTNPSLLRGLASRPRSRLPRPNGVLLDLNPEPAPWHGRTRVDESEVEECVHCPGSESGCQGLDLVHAKRRMRKTAEPDAEVGDVSSPLFGASPVYAGY